MDTLLHHQHTEHHMQSSKILTDIVIGMSDGLTVPFALAAGLSGAVQNTSLIIIAGIAEIAAGSIAMGLGGYLAGKTETDHYNSELKREYDEVEHVPEKEREEVKEFFAGIVEGDVVRYTLPKIGALNFVMYKALGGGVTRTLALDIHGKSLSSAIMNLEIPEK